MLNVEFPSPFSLLEYKFPKQEVQKYALRNLIIPNGKTKTKASSQNSQANHPMGMLKVRKKLFINGYNKSPSSMCNSRTLQCPANSVCFSSS